MMPKTGWRGLGGASKKEASREDLLQQIQAERAARSQQRAQNKAATIIQSQWRSFLARRSLSQQLLQQWHTAYAAAAAQLETVLPVQCLTAAVRLLLMALLPSGSKRSDKALATGVSYTLSGNISAAAGSSIPESAAVKGTFALLLRSIASSDPECNYTAGATGPDALAWRIQAVRLCHLCCLVLAADPAGTADPVIDAAAGRLLQLLTCSAQLGKTDRTDPLAVIRNEEIQHSGSAGYSHGNTSLEPAAAPAATAELILASLCSQPMPLLQAARRLVLCSRLQDQQPGNGQITPAGPTVLQVGTVVSTGLQRVLSVCITLLEVAGSRPEPQHQLYVERFVLLVLTAPGLAAAAPATLQNRMLVPDVMQQQLLPTAMRLAGVRQLSGVDALHCLANLAQLLTGCSQAEGPQQQTCAARVPASQHLKNSNMATAYCRTAVQLLSAAASQCSSHNNPSASRAVTIKGRPQAQQQTSMQPYSTPEHAAAVLRDGLWMLGTQQHLLELMRAVAASSQDGLVLWAGYCAHLLQDTTKIAAAATAAGNTSKNPSPAASSSSLLFSAVLIVLAFAPGILPTMWRWLAVAAGFPLEAPLQASRGLDIAAVAGGPEGLSRHVALVMGLFCRSLAQLLQVLDDSDLHKQQSPFSLGTSRAIASTLNSLVFHTAFPQQPRQPRTKQQELDVSILPATGQYGMALLIQYAPIVLRGYYERDSRQQFCQPNLWTEPYMNMIAALEAQQQPGTGVLATTAAVVQALLAGAGLLGDQDETDVRNTQPAPAAHQASSSMLTSASASSVAGLRTGALLMLLRAAPQCVPFSVRLELFRQMLEQDKVRGRWQASPAEGGPRPLQVTIRRTCLLEDAFSGLASAGCHIKTRLQVHFVNAQGVAEAGIDHGGLMKELLEQVVTAGCQPEYGLFAATEGTNMMYPNPMAEAIPQGLALLEFLGLMVGKALYEGILLNLSFAPCFLLSLQGGRPGLDDLAGLDSQLYSNLLAVKACPAEDVEALGLTFSVEQQLFGKSVQTDLLPGGGCMPVTGDNRLLYVHLLADHLLNTRLGRATSAFAGGLSVVLPASWLRMFSPSEINQLVSGGQEGGLDVEDMQRHARYGNGYSASSHTIKMFWRVVADMSPHERSALLRFITSTSRAPLGGFKHLQPPLTIHRVDCSSSPLAFLGGKDVERLPSASTCYNMLKLPNYRRAATMKQKLLYAIGSGAGFELS